MATIYYYISIASFVLALVFLAIAAIMFFKFDIMKIIGDLSGRNARKSVEAMKNRKVEKDDTSTSLGSRINSELKTEKLQATTAKMGEDEDATAPLEVDEDATVYLDKSEDATVPLQVNNDEDATVPLQLHEDEDATAPLEARCKSGFVVEREITLVHTDKYLL